MNTRRLLSLFLSFTIVFGGIVTVSEAVTSTDFTPDELDCSSYDLRKYTEPYWEGNIVYNEVVHPINNESEQLVPFELMYDASEIVYVKSYDLKTTYKEGTDYVLEGGNLVILPDGSIPVMPYSYMHPTSASPGYGPNDIYPYYPHADGYGYEYWLENAEICKYSLAVTYIHNDTWEGPVPESQEKELPGTFEKLMNDELMTIVVVGDSVAGGALSSKTLSISPYAPAYPEMTVDGLRAKYSNKNIRLVNSAVGGTISTFDQNKVNSSIINHNPDLVIINYGMNDSSADRVGISGDLFRSNIVAHIEYIKEKVPGCEVLLVSSLYGNRYTFPAEKYEEHATILHEIAEEYDGVGVADPQRVEKYLIEEVGKDYICFTADNMVHPGDLGMRLYTQAILEALSFEDPETYRSFVIDKLTKYVEDNNFDPGKNAELAAKIAEVSAAISELDEEWDINTVVDAAYPEIDEILKRCDSHINTDVVIPPTCKDEGYTLSVCNICGYETKHSPTPSLGREHIMDSGITTTLPTYKTEGAITYSCAVCAYTETEVVPILNDPPTLSGQGMMHISNDHNYMAELDLHPYDSGAGYVEFDFCPLSIEKYNGVPYVGIWFANGYTITACYNFDEGQAQIVGTNMTFGDGTVYAAADYDWSSDGGEYEYNWKKFCVAIKGKTVEIYIDGELVLSDTRDIYATSDQVPLIYSNGECYMDNLKVVKGTYDPTTGVGGSLLGYWDMNSYGAVTTCKSDWGQLLCTSKYVNANAENVTTGHYYHSVHKGDIVGVIDSGCDHGGYTQYVCDDCGCMYYDNFTDPLYEDGHALTDPTVSVYPTAYANGLYTYECANCDMTFTEIIPKGTNLGGELNIIGDVDRDGRVGVTDLTSLRRFLAGASVSINTDVADINGDGSIGASDITMLTRKLSTSGMTEN